MFRADRDPHQAFGDAGSRQFLGGQLAVRGGERMAGERLDAAEAHRVARDPQATQELERTRLATFDFERDQRPREVTLGVADAPLLGIREQRRVEYARYAL